MEENKCPSVAIVDPFFGTVKDGETYDMSQHSLPEEFGIYEPNYDPSNSDSFALIYPYATNYIFQGHIREGILINKNGVFRYSVTKRSNSPSMSLTRLNRKTFTFTDDSIGSPPTGISIVNTTKDEMLSADETVIDNGESGELYNAIWIGRFIQTTKPPLINQPTIYTALAFDKLHAYRALLSVPAVTDQNSTLVFEQIS